MSNGPIPFLTPAELSFTPGTPDFTDFVSSELGNLGTDSDGFDLLLNETISLSDEAGNLLTSFDGDLVGASNSIAAFSIGDPATDQASLIPLEHGVDAALNDYTGQLPPPPDSGTNSPRGCPAGTVVGNLTVGQKDPVSYPDIVPPAGFRYHQVYPVMCTNNGPLISTVQTGTFTIDHSNWGDATLVHGDPAIFKMQMNKLNDAGKSWLEHIDLTITPAKAGRFSAVIAYDQQGGNQFGGKHIAQYDVTIVDATVKTPATATVTSNPRIHPV